MASINVNVRLRPIKLAFLVDPHDTDSILRAIEINTCLWGGTFNPLIPTYKKLPSGLNEFGNLSAKKLVTGYLDAFDPDYIVRLGKTSEYSLVFRDVEVISAESIITNLERDGTVAYGIGLFEILNQLIEEEFKYVRHDSSNIVLPNLSDKYRLFVASMFGCLPSSITEIFKEHFKDIINAREEDYSISNYLQGLYSEKEFPRQITGRFHLDVHRKHTWPKDACLFYLDATKAIDIIDYWNLRAVGWRVVPVAKQAYGDEASRDFAIRFVNDHHRLMQHNPQVFHNTTLLKSRSVTKQEFEEFGTNVNRLSFEEGGESKVVLQTWYPRIWDEWGRKRDFVEPCELEADSESHLLNDIEERISFKPLPPKFAAESRSSGRSKYANEIDLRITSVEGLYAEVIPEGTKEVRRAFGYLGGIRSVRLSRNGIVKLLNYPSIHQRIALPKAEDVFIAWLESKEWKAKLSQAGLIAKQMLKQIGGMWGITILARGGLIKLLQRMNERENRTEDQGKATKQNTILRELSDIAKEEGHSNSRYILQELTEAHILRIGFEVQCPTCTRRSWFSVKDIDYANNCVNCGAAIQFPAHAPEQMRWSYRTSGPFRSSNQGDGTYTVLLTLRFFSTLYDGATTPLFSFTAKNDQREIEADLGLLFKKSTFRWSSTKIKVIFAECKTYNYLGHD